MSDNEKKEQLIVEEPNQVVEETKQEKTEHKPEQKIEQVDYKDLFLRVSADLQNFQRRVEKQKAEWTLVAQEAIILKLIPVIEDFDRAISTCATGSEPAVKQWVDGLVVVQKNLKKSLSDLGIEEIMPTGMFNPEYHEAVAQIDSPSHQSGQIVDVVSKGYKFKDKVIKYAQVTVSK